VGVVFGEVCLHPLIHGAARAAVPAVASHLRREIDLVLEFVMFGAFSGRGLLGARSNDGIPGIRGESGWGLPKFAQHPQGVDARIVPITPDDVIGVPSHRSEVRDLDVGKLFWSEVKALGWVMSLTHRTGTGRAQLVEPVVARHPVLPVNHQYRAILRQFKRVGKGVCGEMFRSHKAIESRFLQWLNGPLGRDPRELLTGI